MMKYSVIIAMLCIFLPLNIYSSEYDNGGNHAELHWNHGRKYISYEFGGSNTVKVFIAEGDSICDALIYDEKGGRFSTICPKSAILEWAFDRMPLEIKNARVEADNSYKPFHYTLSLHDDTCQITAASSALHITGNDDFQNRMNELKSFMVGLWCSLRPAKQ